MKRGQKELSSQTRHLFVVIYVNRKMSVLPPDYAFLSMQEDAPHVQ